VASEETANRRRRRGGKPAHGGRGKSGGIELLQVRSISLHKKKEYEEKKIRKSEKHLKETQKW